MDEEYDPMDDLKLTMHFYEKGLNHAHEFINNLLQLPDSVTMGEIKSRIKDHKYYIDKQLIAVADLMLSKKQLTKREMLNIKQYRDTVLKENIPDEI